MADEYQGISTTVSVNKFKGYGSAASSASKGLQPQPTIVSHRVVKSDSLTSLAIHYNSTVADIKRQNKLWNNEALAFRDAVDIPVYNLQSNSSIEASSHPSTSLVDPTDIDLGLGSSAATKCIDANTKDITSNLNNKLSLASTSEPMHTTSDSLDIDVPLNSALATDDFFAKYDQSMSALRKKVETQSAKSPEYEEMDDVLYDSSKARLRPKLPENGSSKGGMGTASQRSSRSSIRSSTDDIRTTPETAIKAKVKKKLKKHEERQEELFTL